VRQCATSPKRKASSRRRAAVATGRRSRCSIGWSPSTIRAFAISAAQGKPLPAYIEKEIEAYLKGGRLRPRSMQSDTAARLSARQNEILNYPRCRAPGHVAACRAPPLNSRLRYAAALPERLTRLYWDFCALVYTVQAAVSQIRERLTNGVSQQRDKGNRNGFAETVMHKFVIERNIPGVGKMSPAELQTVARRSIDVLSELGVEIQWIESYICNDKIYCVYLAADEELIREHGRLTGIPCNSILEISKVIDLTFGSARL
jgi:hypothetical protein